MALLLVGFAILVRIADPIPTQVIRNQTFDLFQRIKPRDAQPLPVAIIDVDDRSITAIGQWPWPRTRFAEIVETATRDGAVAIAFDI
ncbi:MAG: CHASE2 domain-containing protein, partial [Sedimentitalea sp.]|nr:CHASE2 domain-containing protein [Sedimentitalea sp.]